MNDNKKPDKRVIIWLTVFGILVVLAVSLLFIAVFYGYDMSKVLNTRVILSSILPYMGISARII